MELMKNQLDSEDSSWFFWYCYSNGSIIICSCGFHFPWRYAPKSRRRCSGSASSKARPLFARLAVIWVDWVDWPWRWFWGWGCSCRRDRRRYQRLRPIWVCLWLFKRLVRVNSCPCLSIWLFFSWDAAIWKIRAWAVLPHTWLAPRPALFSWGCPCHLFPPGPHSYISCHPRRPNFLQS